MTSRAVVLVVEDEEYLRTTMCAAFTLVGFQPVSAGTVEEALKILGTEPIHAIVLDVRLPDPGGSHRSGLNLLKYSPSDAPARPPPSAGFYRHASDAARRGACASQQGALVLQAAAVCGSD